MTGEGGGWGRGKKVGGRRKRRKAGPEDMAGARSGAPGRLGSRGGANHEARGEVIIGYQVIHNHRHRPPTTKQREHALHDPGVRPIIPSMRACARHGLRAQPNPPQPLGCSPPVASQHHHCGRVHACLPAGAAPMA